MADAADKARAEKLAAGKKRYEQLKKQKDKTKATSEKPPKKKEESPPAEKKASTENAATDATPDSAVKDAETTADASPKPPNEKSSGDADPTSPASREHERKPSLSLQSRMRSSSFRNSTGTLPPTSPTSANGLKGQALPTLSADEEVMTEIYRKQASRLEELERENRRLAKETEAAEVRWRKAEDELDDLRDKSLSMAELKTKADRVEAQALELGEVRKELTTLQRQNAQLNSSNQKSTRRSTSPGQPPSALADDLKAQLESKTATIETMEMEISRLRADANSSSSKTASHAEQVSALEEKQERAERAAGAAQRELLDLRKTVERLSEKAVKEGSERTSAETKIRSLTAEAETSGKSAAEALKRVETLEKKLAAMTTLHKEAETRRHQGERDREGSDRDATALRHRVSQLETENLRLREESRKLRQQTGTVGGTDNDGVDELEDEARRVLEARIRDLEAELHETRRGVWQDKKREISQGTHLQSPGGSGFDEVDLSASSPQYTTQALRRPSNKTYNSNGHSAAAAAAAGGGGGGGSGNGGGSGGPSLASALASGIQTLTGTGTGAGGDRPSLDLLDDDDDAAGFDPAAFQAAHAAEAQQRLERVRELKRALRDWQGYRLDLVDVRTAGAGDMVDVFEI